MTRDQMSRRQFIKAGAGLVAGPMLAVRGSSHDPQANWLRLHRDPVYGMISGGPDLDHILSLFPRPQGEAAFDAAAIAENIEAPHPSGDRHEDIPSSTCPSRPPWPTSYRRSGRPSQVRRRHVRVPNTTGSRRRSSQQSTPCRRGAWTAPADCSATGWTASCERMDMVMAHRKRVQPIIPLLAAAGRRSARRAGGPVDSVLDAPLPSTCSGFPRAGEEKEDGLISGSPETDTREGRRSK